MATGLRRRLLVMLIAPLILLAFASAWSNYRSTENVAAQQDLRLLGLVPLLADSVIGEGLRGDAVLLLVAPPVEEFMKDRPGYSAYAILDADGKVMHGESWLAGQVPPTREAELHSEERGGTRWRIVSQRQQTVLGELIFVVADGSDPRQQWVRAILIKVLLPNLILIAAAAFAVRWAVQLALRPLMTLRGAVERRSPRDLSPIDVQGTPVEVRPLVQSLNRLFALVEAQAEGHRRFVADAAHQLRTPLAGLQAQVEAWGQAAQARSADDFLPLPVDQVQKLRAATRRTSQLANQLLALSRADVGSMEGQPMQPIELKTLCEATLETFLDAASAKQIDLGLDAEPARVMGHEWLLRELLANLADNAVRYTPAGGTVTIRCGRHDGDAFIEVEDDGPGVPAGERSRILERFYRLQGTGGEGTGLGLAIADEIARVHHGQLLLSEGHGGRGLRVRAKFPG
ncbi:ATP-binding protein [Ramlibacter sp.]|uniref:ATP-binding protein n=1 Tax=Ramlibacter sp. TaxID=1917967 RepID=UPI003D0DBF2F